MCLRIVLLALFIVAFKYHHTHAGLFLFVFTIFYHIYTEGEENAQRAYRTKIQKLHIKEAVLFKLCMGAILRLYFPDLSFGRLSELLKCLCRRYSNTDRRLSRLGPLMVKLEALAQTSIQILYTS